MMISVYLYTHVYKYFKKEVQQRKTSISPYLEIVNMILFLKTCSGIIFLFNMKVKSCFYKNRKQQFFKGFKYLYKKYTLVTATIPDYYPVNIKVYQKTLLVVFIPHNKCTIQPPKSVSLFNLIFNRPG